VRGGCLTRGYKYNAVTGKLLVLWKKKRLLRRGGHLGEVVATRDLNVFTEINSLGFISVECCYVIILLFHHLVEFQEIY